MLYDYKNCSLCPNDCNTDRTKNHGRCGVGDKVRIAKFYLHPFEEPIISDEKGSGTIFFCGCSLRCVFCQNYEVSRAQRGKEIDENQLADIFKTLEDEGATNINLVTPTQFSLSIMKAIEIYKPKIPVVYNTHGYEKSELIEKLCDYVDIFMPDLKYFSPLRAKRYCGKEDYFSVAFNAVKFMIKKKRAVEENGVLKSGVIVRHLVLPQNLDETQNILSALRPEINDAYLSLMSQYTPFGEYEKYPELKRKITRHEYERAKAIVENLDFQKVYYQDFESQSKKFIPDWDY